ncbi:unnamed protein product [Clonostachys byssicola]|uniref:Beta-catenin-like protein 1 N-terminal domain-containing protein n=1 Tax=Clonostachys byssicola TaxID=160290 RepID=A0A9N9U968_9HYPO|nr:unnamed protein product [Clonostachys byssicola]
MASVDEIFKNSGLPSKRRLDPIRDPNEIYKSAKLDSRGPNRHAQVEDADDDIEAGPALPPDGEEEYGPSIPIDEEKGDDEEGRFFGGGISKQESEILDFVEGADNGREQDKIDGSWLRRTALNFEKHIAKNAELRAKFESEPQKFIASEADLDADIKALSILAEHPELFPDFASLGCVGSLVSLLAHENTDIAIDAIEIIGELTDEDVVAEDAQWNALVDALLDADLLSLIVSNFSRLNEEDEADRSGVYFSLGVIENLCSRSAVATRIGQEDKLVHWLLDRIQRKELAISQNKQYAAEILAILSQASAENRNKLIKLDAIDKMLQLVASYLRRDPEKGSEEEEYMENLFEALTCLADEPEGKTKFIEAEGIELCLLLFKGGKMSRSPALRLLDHATASKTGTEVCEKLVDAGGLKGTFTLFMKSQDHRLLSHLLNIFASMLRLLPANSAERIRLLAKFVEKDYEKLRKLTKLRHEYSRQIKQAEEKNKQERLSSMEEDREELEIEWLSRRHDAGLFILQAIDVILAWLSAEDGGASRRIKQLLAERDETMAVIKATLTEQLEALDAEEEDGRDLKDMLGTLVELLR